MTRDCEEFLAIANRFKLGTLLTESPHPRTRNLSQEARFELPVAIETLKTVDAEALMKFESYVADVIELGAAIRQTLENKKRVFLCGCGATGRLAIALEVFCRQGMVIPEYQNNFISFMAGGDAALIKSIEAFEDHPEYGARQLKELGFANGDLLISSTEGGETPFVIGATEAAARLSNNKPWFLYCNPEQQMVQEVVRSGRVLKNPDIRSKSLCVGPMALSGSTRMQASTVLMAGVGLAISHGSESQSIIDRLREFQRIWNDLDLEPLADFTREEAHCYQNGEFVIYETHDYGVTVLTDTTERSPTFSLPPFENEQTLSDPPSWCYLSITGAKDSRSAWHALLMRAPRCLEWEGIQSVTGKEFLYGFYIDSSCLKKRLQKTDNAKQNSFTIQSTPMGFRFNFKGLSWDIRTPDLNDFEQNLLLKLILNIHSTALMGHLNRFESNLMTFVKPTNYKLIDRTIRYVQQLSEHRKRTVPSYATVAKQLFALKDHLHEDEPIVLRILEKLGIN